MALWTAHYYYIISLYSFSVDRKPVIPASRGKRMYEEMNSDIEDVKRPKTLFERNPSPQKKVSLVSSPPTRGRGRGWGGIVRPPPSVSPLLGNAAAPSHTAIRPGTGDEGAWLSFN